MIRRTIGLLSSHGSERPTDTEELSGRWFFEVTRPLLGRGDGIPSAEGLCRELLISLDADTCFVVKNSNPGLIAHLAASGDTEFEAPWTSEMLTPELQTCLSGSDSYLLSVDARAEPCTRQLANIRGVQGLAVAPMQWTSSVNGFIFVEFRAEPPELDDRHGRFLVAAARICSSAIKTLEERDRRHQAEEARTALLDDLANAEARGRSRLARQVEQGPLASLRAVCGELMTAPDRSEHVLRLADELTTLEAMLGDPEPTATLSEAINSVVLNFGPSDSQPITVRDFTTHGVTAGNHALLLRLVEASLDEIMSSRKAEHVLIVVRSAGNGTLLSIRASSRGLSDIGQAVGVGDLDEDTDVAVEGGAANSAELDVVCTQILMAGGKCSAQLQSLGMSSVKAWFPD